jgi:hypothetical protein
MLRFPLLAASFCALLVSGHAEAQDSGALRARHAALQQQLAGSPFGRPLHVESAVEGGTHKGEVHAVLDQPYAAAAAALARPAHWCDILTLQINIKRCEVSSETLVAFVTKRPRDPVSSAHRIDFRFDVAARRADYLHVALNAPSGPMGTRDYEIRLEAAPLDARRTFIHLSYGYTLGAMARLAMDAYLVGPGRDKTGFSVAERRSDGSPVYVDGVRGVAERSAMRYYLAIDASLGALAVPPAQRLDARLRRWYTEAARYPQLKEKVGADEYVEMKRREAAS